MDGIDWASVIGNNWELIVALVGSGGLIALITQKLFKKRLGVDSGVVIHIIVLSMATIETAAAYVVAHITEWGLPPKYIPYIYGIAIFSYESVKAFRKIFGSDKATQEARLAQALNGEDAPAIPADVPAATGEFIQ